MDRGRAARVLTDLHWLNHDRDGDRSFPRARQWFDLIATALIRSGQLRCPSRARYSCGRETAAPRTEGALMPGPLGLMVTQNLPGETAKRRGASLAPRPGDEPSWLLKFCLEKQRRSGPEPKGPGISAPSVQGRGGLATAASQWRSVRTCAARPRSTLKTQPSTRSRPLFDAAAPRR